MRGDEFHIPTFPSIISISIGDDKQRMLPFSSFRVVKPQESWIIDQRGIIVNFIQPIINILSITRYLGNIWINQGNCFHHQFPKLENLLVAMRDKEGWKFFTRLCISIVDLVSTNFSLMRWISITIFHPMP